MMLLSHKEQVMGGGLHLHSLLIAIATTSRNKPEVTGTEGAGCLKRQPFAFGGVGAQGSCGVPTCGCLCVLVAASWDTPPPPPRGRQLVVSSQRGTTDVLCGF